jgi:mono/diheme cytochrome c family protein
MSADRLVRVRRAGALALVTVLTACSWFTDFKQQPKYDPWESADTVAMRANPQSSVPVYGTFAAGFAVSRAALPGTIDSMASIPNPVVPDARSLLNGRKYYTINCAVCHGYEGKGDGPVVAKGFPGIPLVGPASPAPGRTDGYIWGMIRNGRGLMPTYNRIEELDRWDVVNYVRGLQGRYAVVTGPVGLPGETGDKVPGFSQSGPTRPSPYYDHVGSQAGPWPGGTGVTMTSGGGAPTRSPADTGAARRDTAAARPTVPNAPAPAGAAPRPTVTPASPTGGAR